MADTKVEWAEKTWNPVTGCTKISAGCANCYAERMVQRLKGRFGYPAEEPFRVTLHPDRFVEPLRWRKPRTVFVSSMGDLFHTDVPDEFLKQVFAIMAATPQHTYLVLTKRPRQMSRFIATKPWFGKRIRFGEGKKTLVDHTCSHSVLPNVWLGTSCENQAAADERIPHLMQCEAAVRFLSLEPLLGPIEVPPGIDWVIAGGESGSSARPCNIDWIRSIVNQCRDAGTPVFVKQLGRRPCFFRVPSIHDGWGRWQIDCVIEDGGWWPQVAHPKGGDPLEWPADLRVREMPR